MIAMGIDPSINSTGICIYDSTSNTHNYFNIVSKMTKKMAKFSHESVTLILYNKTNGGNDYIEKEHNKTNNIYNIACIILELAERFEPDVIYMEGVSYGSIHSAAIVDLSGLNFTIRALLLTKGYKCNIVSPTQVKKFAIANGGADKELMINAWKMCDQNINDITTIKIDDLADSYFIAHLVDN